jgi:hypothetical protein
MLTKVRVNGFAVAGLLLGLAGCVAELGDEESSTEQYVLPPPMQVMVASTAVDRVNVSWTEVPGATKYYVYQSTDMAGPYTLVASVRSPSTSTPVAHLTPNTNYCFEVRSEDGTGPGAFSTPTCTSTETFPPASTSIVATQQTDTSVAVRWNPVENATKYYLYSSTSLNGTYSYRLTVLAPYTTYLDTNLTANATYCYKVQAQTANGRSPLTAGTCNTTIQPPTNVTVSPNGPGRVNVTWTIAAGAAKTYVFESANGGPYALRCSILSAATQTCARAGLASGTQYCYELQTEGTPSTNRSSLSVPIVCGTAP